MSAQCIWHGRAQAALRMSFRVFILLHALPHGAASQQPTANSEVAAAEGLVAQFQAVLIRERRLADDRETGLIARLELRLRRARDGADSVLAGTDGELRKARADLVSTSVEQVKSEPLRHLTEITKAVALEKPELAKLFRLFVRSPNEQEFRAGVQGFIVRIRTCSPSTGCAAR